MMQDVIAQAHRDYREAVAAWEYAQRGPYNPLRGSVNNAAIYFGNVVIRLGGTL